VIRTLPCLVGERWVADGRLVDVTDPATDGEVVARMPALDADAADDSLDAALAAQSRWRAVPPAGRAEALRRAADLLEEHAAEVVEDLRAEGGKPLAEARAEAGKAVLTYRYYAGLAGALDGRAFEGARPALRHETRLEPVGVAVAITPWNVPAAAPARKLAPALLAGDAVVLKPASATPLSAHHQVRALVDAGVPAGAVQLVVGAGRTLGTALATDRRVAAVSFTGSTEVGLGLKAALGQSLTRLQLELGGKNAAVVLADADLDAAAGHIVAAAFALAGQQCTATSRVVVQRAVAVPLVERLVAACEALTVGDTSDERTRMGPLIDADQVALVDGFVGRALAGGATLACGGRRIERPGHFYAPTVLTGVTSAMEVASSEVFGPVLAVVEVGTPEEAVEVHNATAYGLSGAVHTRDLAAAQRFADAAASGVVAVNGPTAGIELAAPFGGFGMSGTGDKEHGPESLRFYTRTKLVSWGW
jgi:acyl-CoA reductase-like NAD-dependent aldehyde dehydrogenase